MRMRWRLQREEAVVVEVVSPGEVHDEGAVKLDEKLGETQVHTTVLQLTSNAIKDAIAFKRKVGTCSWDQKFAYACEAKISLTD